MSGYRVYQAFTFSAARCGANRYDHIEGCVIGGLDGRASNTRSRGCFNSPVLDFGSGRATSDYNISRDLPTEIVPGASVGPIRLGDQEKRIVEELSGFPKIVQQVTYPMCGTIRMTEWFDKALLQTGLFIYLRKNSVFQIESETTRFRTADGITEQSLPEDVERHYADMQAYELLSSASDLVGNRNLIYWVDHDKGVAFGFYYNTRKHRRLVYRVLIFQPKTDFQPNGCVTPPQKLRQLRSYSLDPPANAT